MRTSTRDVVVTGLGAVSALGHDCDELLEAISSGRSGIVRIRRFDTSDFSVHLGAEVKDWPVGPKPDASALCRGFSVRAVREALARAELPPGAYAPERVGFVFGTGLIDGRAPVHELACSIADEVGALGPRVTVSTACSSSTGAIGLARDLIALGAADLVLAGGADVLSPSVFAGFHALGVLSPEKCAPFSFPFGTTLGEGAGFLLLERGSAAQARSATVLARLSGYGLSADAYHETSPDPEGKGVTRAVRGALSDSGVSSSDVGYVNAHGSGTEANDPSEWMGIRRGLGRNRCVPVSSSKGALGHAQGAAGALESIVTILGMIGDFVAPTLNFTGPRRSSPTDAVGEAWPRISSFDHALCLNSAFGGSNVALVYSRPEVGPPPAPVRRSVRVLGMGILGPEEANGRRAVDQFRRSHVLSGSIPPFSVQDFARRTDPRGLDPSSRFLIGASALALRDAGICVRGATRDRIGIISGSLRPSPASVESFGDSVSKRGLSGLSAAAFARIVLNAPTGFCAKELGLRGPHTALATGAGSGLMAIILAAEILSTRPEVSFMLGTAVDELASDDSPESFAERAVAVVLGAAGESTSDAPEREWEAPIRVAGWGISRPGDADGAVAAARTMAVHETEAVDATPEDSIFDEADYLAEPGMDAAAPSALAFCDAVRSLKERATRQALVTSAMGSSVSLAVLLSRSTPFPEHRP